eukprot:PhF_6_TR31400/c0_g1_i2/m.46008
MGCVLCGGSGFGVCQISKVCSFRNCTQLMDYIRMRRGMKSWPRDGPKRSLQTPATVVIHEQEMTPNQQHHSLRVLMFPLLLLLLVLLRTLLRVTKGHRPSQIGVTLTQLL